MVVFEGRLLMRMMTVVSVTEKNIFSKIKYDEISYYELYSIATSSFTPSHTLMVPLLHSISTKTCET